MVEDGTQKPESRIELGWVGFFRVFGAKETSEASVIGSSESLKEERARLLGN